MKYTFEMIIREKEAKILESAGAEVKFLNEIDKNLTEYDDIAEYEITVKDFEDFVGHLIAKITKE